MGQRRLKSLFLRARPPMSLISDLYAFYRDHQRCGERDEGVEGDCIWAHTSLSPIHPLICAAHVRQSAAQITR
jgi:hypothetical protein